jgi:RNA polymerase sigma-70 factor (ECF subfamily)
VTDEALMRAVRAGDLAKLGSLFERYHVRLFEFLCRMTGDRAAAEDLVQDIFMRVLKYRASYQEGLPFDTWLFRIARNARADYFRVRRPTEPVDADCHKVADPAAGPGRQLESSRDHLRLKRALLALREDQRELIVLARYQGLKHAEIGALLGVDAAVVKVRIHRAVRELREIFLQTPDGHESWDVTFEPTSQTT